MKMQTSSEFRRSSLAALCSSVVIAGSLVLPCIELFCSNRAEFTFGLGRVLLISAAFAVFVILLLWPLQMLFRHCKFFDTLIALMLATGAAIWLQYAFYSEIVPDLSSDQVGFTPIVLLFMLFNLLLLLLPYALFLWQKKWFVRHCLEVTVIILAPQLLPVVWKMATYTQPNYDFYEYTIDEDEKFTFAKEENVILLVVDAMGEYIFRQVWQKYPELRQSLKDFTCFDRMVSTVPSTSYAVPAMLSGINYSGNHLEDGEAKHAEYLKMACWSENSLLLNFKKLGWHTDAYPFILQTVCYSPELLDNAVIRNDHEQSNQLLLDVLFSRMTPLFLKFLLKDSYLMLTDPFVTPLESSAVSMDDPYDWTFYQQLGKRAAIGTFDKGFKYLHLQGAHAYIRTDEHLEYTYNTDVVRQLRGSLKNLELLIEKLKELGLYDQALIVVSGDHSERYTQETVTMIKRAGETHEQMQFNSLPAKLSDLAGTVLAEKKLRPVQLSLFSYPPVISTGETRLSVIPTILPVGTWSKKADATDPFQEELVLSDMNFVTEKDCLRIPVSGNKELPTEVLFMVQHLHNKEIWQTESVALREDSLPPNFYQLSLEGLPDGDYILFQVDKYTVQDTSFTNEISTTSDSYNIAYFPHYLILRNALPSFSKRYPGIIPRPMTINEKIVFEAMKPYPQLIIPDDSTRTRFGLRLKENSTLEVLLPEAEKRLSLLLDMKIITPNGLTLEIYHDRKLLHSQAVKPANKEFFPVEFSLPADVVASRNAKLQFRIVRKFLNREKRTAYKILLSSLQLKEKR
ncbi:MAG: hypothetical protein GX927_05930 [Lentisphaerae bacterium]|nr:hypothetical protein [Lentisphaerota bacterium]